MHDVEKNMKSVQKQLRNWAEKAKQEYPSHLENSVRHAVDRLDPAALARASEEVVATVTGNRKTARRARKAVETSLRHAKRKAGSKCPGSGRMWAALGTAAVIGLLTVVVLRRAASIKTENPGGPKTDTGSARTGIDPDLDL